MKAKTSKAVQERSERVKRILPALMRAYPDAKCSLNHHNPLELLVATILSAQCTDQRVNIVTRDLFAKYKTAADYAKAPEGELEREIQSTGFYRAKAKSIRAMATALVERFGGQVPSTMEELTSLAGVGRKTANVVLGNTFGQSVGIVVDTHVARLSQRLGLTRQSNPEKIEQDLMQVVPQPPWTLWAHLMIYHGRAVCNARNPNCANCPILSDCPTGPKLLAKASGKRKASK